MKTIRKASHNTRVNKAVLSILMFMIGTVSMKAPNGGVPTGCCLTTGSPIGIPGMSINDPCVNHHLYPFHEAYFIDERAAVLADTIGSAGDTRMAVWPLFYTYIGGWPAMACDDNGAPDGIRSRFRFATLTNENLKDFMIFAKNKTGSSGLVNINVYAVGRNALAAGLYHGLAIKTDGTAWAWGDNSYGQLGNTAVGWWSPTPVQVSGVSGPLTGVRMVAASWFHSLALTTNGTVYAWGGNYFGALGTGTWTDSPFAIAVPNLTGVMYISVGAFTSYAVKTNGTVWAWGWNETGALGVGYTNFASNVPLQVGVYNCEKIAGGEQAAIVLKNNGTVWGWGNNADGEVGDGTTTRRLTPVRTGLLSSTILGNVREIAMGGKHGLAVKLNGALWAWGHNGYGQIGDNTTQNRSTPVKVLTSVSSMEAGGAHSIAVKFDGTAWAWGKNDAGQVGDNTTVNRLVPTSITMGPEVPIVFKGGYDFTLHFKLNLTTRAWGANWIGQLGDGTTTQRLTPAVTGFDLDAF